MTHKITIWTLDWVPGGENGPSGFVRDLRLRWACEEAGLPYEMKTVPLTEKPGAEHFARQPFGQVPFLEDGEIKMFESGACLLHLAKKSEKLMPKDAKGEAETLQWTISALNSIEMVTVPWWFLGLSGAKENPLEPWAHMRLQHLDQAMAGKEWIAAGRFTVADLLMADVLRVPKVRAVLSENLKSYVDRVLARPSFRKAFEEQKAHFAKAEKARGGA